MFTVIFAEKETIKLFEETKMFFDPLLDAEKAAFCEWNVKAENFEEAVPGLYDLIEYQNEWRALVLYNGAEDSHNPFDYTGYTEMPLKEGEREWVYYRTRRMNRFKAYEKAIDNPLLQLTVGLCGVPGFKSVITDRADYEALLSGDMQSYEYMLKCQLDEINCGETASRLEKFQRDSLKRFVEEDNIDRLLACFREKRVSELAKLINENDLTDFIRFVGNNPMWYDPEYMECLIENTKKAELLSSVAEDFSMTDKLPSEIICFSLRTFNFETTEQDIKWKNKDENDYSRFADYNLYSDKLKYLLFDTLPRNNKQYRFELIKMMCMLLLIATNELPSGLVKAKHVYRTAIDFDSGIVAKICEGYISKLKATERVLIELGMQVERDSETSVDDRTARRLFESDVDIPIKMESVESPSDLLADPKRIGMAFDCPEYEDVAWGRQFRKINKSLTRYLRAPRRAVKHAVSDGLYRNNKIEDDRTLLLSENQIEDVKYHLAEEERRMIDSMATRLFDSKKYTEQMQKADKEINEEIEKRMTRSKTLWVCGMALLAYFIGFIPLLFGHINTVKSFLFSLAIMGVVMAIFAIIGFVYLRILRNRLVFKYKKFNMVMNGICGEINGSLSQYSGYLSCVCNIMRDYSVLQKRDSYVEIVKKILAFHNVKIKEQISSIHELFSRYVDFSKLKVTECEPYDFDFTVMRDYQYEMPSVHSKKRIEFFQKGNDIIVPIDYVNSVSITREELYD